MLLFIIRNISELNEIKIRKHVTILVAFFQREQLSFKGLLDDQFTLKIRVFHAENVSYPGETDNTYSIILKYLRIEGKKIVFKLFPFIDATITKPSEHHWLETNISTRFKGFNTLFFWICFFICTSEISNPISSQGINTPHSSPMTTFRACVYYLGF